MPQDFETETCQQCEGEGSYTNDKGIDKKPHKMTKKEIQKRIEELQAKAAERTPTDRPDSYDNIFGDSENEEVAPLVEPEGQMVPEGFEASIDLTDDTPAPGRMANQTWRILEEQKQAAEETIREAETEIERWTKKMVDAIKTKHGCEAGQRALEGGA